MQRLVCLGLSHRTAPVELRERIGSLGLGVERCPAVVEHAVLQTCYRVELYAHLTVGQEDGIREGPPDIDPQRAHGCIRTRTPE